MSVLKKYLFWTYPRGSVHYDVMVTFLLLFIFVTPHLWNYGDRQPEADAVTHPVTVSRTPEGRFYFELNAADAVPRRGENTPGPALRRAIRAIAGEALQMDRYEAVPGADGAPATYRVWAHR
jgi:hypothetical protein